MAPLTNDKIILMKVYLHFEITQSPWGGGNSFLKSLMANFDRRQDVEVLTQPARDCDIFLLNGEMPLHDA